MTDQKTVPPHIHGLYQDASTSWTLMMHVCFSGAAPVLLRLLCSTMSIPFTTDDVIGVILSLAHLIRLRLLLSQGLIQLIYEPTDL